VEGRPTEDAELIVRAREGEVMAYEELVRRYQDVAVRTAHLISPDGDAEDAVQEDRRPGDAAPSPESAVLADETRSTLLAAINGLRDEDREVIGARYFLDLSEAETAEALGLPKGTVKSRLSRALDRLRAQLATDGEASRG
jgi:RNA polymerase sigma-70 factor (ECF subfamily)